MDYLDNINLILKRLTDSKEFLYVDEIRSLKNSASTSSELLMSVTHELIAITDRDPRMNTLVGKETRELRDYCHSIGLMVS